ncbi:two-component sensor histidine kinase [Actinorhabdospora filicis]|uniref:Signal transduction histidine-protein kinase/phosphatase MprB n=1 Tax=Actinorhabdospora filicis TaxID=1785913 RepID=A0A9W6WCV0_9ACTN|nr:HAMP domain-containing sensor histidine kinase [Actinorhabdospora filicis]GLZ80180.1 two-component sensor histidine kinase [Actinorhabdospora filicis]
MRWALVRVALATTSMVALALLVPLAIVVGRLAHDRAVTAARDQSAAMVTVLAVTDDSGEILRAMLATRAGANGRLAVHVPGRAVLGTPHAATGDVDTAASEGRSLIAEAETGLVYLRTVALPGGTAVIEVFVPDGELTKGVTGARIALATLAFVLVLISVVTADRLGARLVRTARGLGDAARRFGEGDLSTRVDTDGPRELAEAGAAFNAMADQVVGIVDAEREIAADLSHRLRTPLTALRLDADALPPGPDADRIREAADSLQRQVDEIILGARRSVTERTGDACDVDEVLTERLAFWAVLAEDHGRRWTAEGTGRSLWVPVAKSELSAAVDAMLGNVFAHTPQGAPFQAVLDVRRRILAVEDGGPGIADPEEAMERGRSGAGSTGLGLDIVRRVADATGGSLHLGHSRLGGARVALVFGRPQSERQPRKYWRSRHRAETK